ncbi:MAG: hypothetical protein AMXMBFR64_53490 [Myxococcales bacterium]
MLLELRGLSKYYGAYQALKDVSVDVREGCVGLLGPNGAGKSTLIRTILGLLDFAAGEGRVLGHDIRRQCMAVRQRAGYMPEHDAAFPGTTGLEMAAYGAELSGLRRDDAISRAHEMLDYVGLGEERYRPTEEYSTGMKQRAKLAQALVHGPELVLLDEPTNGLDPIGREEMLWLIGDVARAGVNVILSSHLLHDVERVCDSVILMQDGRVTHYGDVATFTKGEAEQVELELRGGGGLDAFIAAAAARGIAMERLDDPDRLQASMVRGDEAEVLLALAVAGGYEVRHLAPRSVTLESAFMRFVEGA